MSSRRLTWILLPAVLWLGVSTASAAPTYDEALALYKARRYPEARVAFQELSLAEPAHAKARYFLGVIAIKRNDTAAAILQLQKAIELDPTNADYHAELGGAHGLAAKQASLLDQIHHARACRAALEKAVELNPDHLEARRGLVDYYRQAPSFLGGGVMKAYRQAEAILERDPVMGTLLLGQLMVADHRFEEAIALFRQLLERQPDNYLAHYSIGRIAAESGRDTDSGQTHLQRCLQLTPASDEPSHAAVHWRLGNLAERRKDPAAARVAYETALTLDPNFQQARTSLAKLPPSPDSAS